MSIRIEDCWSTDTDRLMALGTRFLVLGTKATQHREVQGVESSEFTFLFSPLTILSGGVRSGFNHVTPTETSIFRLLQITTTGGGSRSGVLVREREAKWTSLNEGDVFVLDEGAKLTAWQGKKSSPIEKMKAAQAISAIANESDRRGQAKTEVLCESKVMPETEVVTDSVRPFHSARRPTRRRLHQDAWRRRRLEDFPTHGRFSGTTAAHGEQLTSRRGRSGGRPAGAPFPPL